MRPCLALAAVLAVAVPACAHPHAAATMDSLRTANEAFYRFLRWNVLRDASQIIVAESRKAWLDKALDAKDDDNLKITEYEMDDLQLGDTNGGTSVVKLTWHRIPSVTTRTDRVTLEWVSRGGVWFVNSIKSGPLPLDAPSPDAGMPDSDGGVPGTKP